MQDGLTTLEKLINQNWLLKQLLDVQKNPKSSQNVTRMSSGSHKVLTKKKISTFYYEMDKTSAAHFIFKMSCAPQLEHTNGTTDFFHFS